MSATPDVKNPPAGASDMTHIVLTFDNNKLASSLYGQFDENLARIEQKLYVIGFPPTAECLARHWFERLGPAIARRSGGHAELTGVRVWETPNCWADFGVANLVQAARSAVLAEPAF